MNKFRFTINAVAITIFMLAFASMAQAQATRTWVSGVGDDVNPCSRTAPCKTFAGAISKTAVNGEISVLDPGGFGTLNITKGITVDGTTGAGFGSTLSTLTTGFIINISAPVANDQQKVILRNLSINGSQGSGAASSGGNMGIRILAAKGVSIENCSIIGFTSGNAQGIRDERTAANSLLSVVNTNIRNNGSHGIIIGTGGANVKATFSNVNSSQNGGIGFAVIGGSRATAINCVASGNISNAGFEAEAGSLFDLESCVASNNATGVLVQTGATVRMSNVNVSLNTTGVNNSASTVRSFGNNHIDSNNTNVSGTILGPGTGGPSNQ